MDTIKRRTVALLRWSERYTKTDMVYLAKGGGWLIFGHLMQLIGGLILVIAFTNLISKEAYGTYQFVMSGASIITAFTLSGMGTAISRAVAQGSDGALPYGFRKQFIWNIGVVLAGVAAAIYYFVAGNHDLGIAFLIVGVFEALLSGFSLYRPFLIGKELFKESTVLGIWRRPLPIVAIIITLFLTDDPVILVFVYFVSNTVVVGLMYLFVRRRYPAPPSPDPELIRYSKHLSIVGMVSRIAGNIDKIIIFHFLGAAPVAIYTLALFPISHLHNMFGLAGNLVLPKFAKRDISELKRTLPRKIWIFFGITAIVAILYIAVAPHMFKLLFPAYPEAVLLTQLGILSILAKPRSLYEQVFNAHGMERPFYITRFTSSAAKAVLFLVLIPLYGLMGAMIAFLAFNLFAALMSTIVFHRYTKNA